MERARVLAFLRRASHLEMDVDSLRRQLNEVHRVDLLALFDELDRECKGSVTAADVRFFMETHNTVLSPSDTEYMALIRQYDVDRDGKWSRAEFVRAVRPDGAAGLRSGGVVSALSAGTLVRFFESEITLYTHLERERRMMLDVCDISAHAAYAFLQGVDSPRRSPPPYLSSRTILDAFTYHGMPLAQDELHALLSRLDLDHDDLLSYTDFVTFFRAGTVEEYMSELYCRLMSAACPTCGARSQRDSASAGCPNVTCPVCNTNYKCEFVVDDYDGLAIHPTGYYDARRDSPSMARPSASPRGGRRSPFGSPYLLRERDSPTLSPDKFAANRPTKFAPPEPLQLEDAERAGSPLRSRPDSPMTPPLARSAAYSRAAYSRAAYSSPASERVSSRFAPSYLSPAARRSFYERALEAERNLAAASAATAAADAAVAAADARAAAWRESWPGRGAALHAWKEGDTRVPSCSVPKLNSGKVATAAAARYEEPHTATPSRRMRSPFDAAERFDSPNTPYAVRALDFDRMGSPSAMRQTPAARSAIRSSVRSASATALSAPPRSAWRSSYGSPKAATSPSKALSLGGGAHADWETKVKVLAALKEVAVRDAALEVHKQRLGVPVEDLFWLLSSGDGVVGSYALQRAMRELGLHSSRYDVLRLIRNVQSMLPAAVRKLGGAPGHLNFFDFTQLSQPRSSREYKAFLGGECGGAKADVLSTLYVLRFTQECPKCLSHCHRDSQWEGCPSVDCPACGHHFRCHVVANKQSEIADVFKRTAERSVLELSTHQQEQLQALLCAHLDAVHELGVSQRLLSEQLREAQSKGYAAYAAYATATQALKDLRAQHSLSGDGFTREDFAHCFAAHRMTVSNDELDHLMQRYDRYGIGKVDPHDVVEHLLSPQ